MRIASWNVNGLRAIHKKGFLDWLERSGADVVAVQETRCRPEQLPDEVREPAGWHTRFVAAERKGYSGVAIYSRRPIDAIETSLGVGTMDREGRYLLAHIGALRVVSAYFPNGNGTHRDNSRVPFKLRFTRRVRRALEADKQAGAPVVVTGDFNIAPEAIDLSRPKQNLKTSGFLPAERKEMRIWRREGWVDAFRALEPGGEHYTWWSQRFGVRERNVGWRIDLSMISPGAEKHLRAASHHPEIRGSDHCPISIDLDDAVTE